MEKFFLRSITIFIVVLIQTTFLVVLFPQYIVPNLIMMTAIAWTVIVGFERIWPWIILLGMALDLVSFSPVGQNVIILILITYIVSFLSRRFLVESQGIGFLIIVFFILIAGALNNLFNIFWIDATEIIRNLEINKNYKFIIKNFFIQSAFNVAAFYFMYWGLTKIEEKIKFYEQRVKL